MIETIIVECKIGTGNWFECKRVNDLEIRSYKITGEQVAAYIRQHPNPLDKLFVNPQYRIIYRIEQAPIDQEIDRFLSPIGATP